MTTEPSDVELMAAAKQIQARAHAPYSKFQVGSAVRAGGTIYTGANIENASYGLAICAERTAVIAAVLAGERTVDAVAVYTDSRPPSSPCGACRQFIAEFAAPAGVRVIAFNREGMRRDWTLDHLLPDAFSGKELP